VYPVQDQGIGFDDYGSQETMTAARFTPPARMPVPVADDPRCNPVATWYLWRFPRERAALRE